MHQTSTQGQFHLTVCINGRMPPTDTPNLLKRCSHSLQVMKALFYSKNKQTNKLVTFYAHERMIILFIFQKVHFYFIIVLWGLIFFAGCRCYP